MFSRSQNYNDLMSTDTIIHKTIDIGDNELYSRVEINSQATPIGSNPSFLQTEKLLSYNNGDKYDKKVRHA